MKINSDLRTVANNFNPLNWERPTKQRMLYAGAMSVVALAGLAALSNLPSAQALSRSQISGTCKVRSVPQWQHEQCSISPSLADFSTNQELFLYGAHQVRYAAASTLALVGRAIASLFSSIIQDVVSGDAAYRSCLQEGGLFCGPKTFESNVFYKNCLNNGGSAVVCEYLR